MIVACTIVWIWLVAYVLKQVLFGRERFGGLDAHYWSLYLPLAVTTIRLGGYNLYMGFTDSLRRRRRDVVSVVATAGLDLLRYYGDGLPGLSHVVHLIPGVVRRIRIEASSCRFQGLRIDPRRKLEI